MKMAKFLVSHFDAGSEKFKAGEVYDVTDETRLCIARGAAEEVDFNDEPAAEAAPETPAAAGETEATAAETKPADGETPAGAAKTAAKAKK